MASAGITTYEVIVVDDGSTDGTGAAAEAAGARVLHHPQNLGYGRSLKDGILAAQHEVIVTADADGTYPLDRIPELLAERERGIDLVVGARTGPHFRESLIKAPMRGLLKWLIEFTVGREVPDVNSGLRVFGRSTILPDLKQLCDTFSFTTSMTLAFLLKKRFVSHVPIPYRARIGTTKVRLLRDSLRTLQFIVQAIVFYNPLKLFLLLAVACSARGCGWRYGGSARRAARRTPPLRRPRPSRRLSSSRWDS